MSNTFVEDFNRKLSDRILKALTSLTYYSYVHQKSVRDFRQKRNEDNRRWAWVLVGKTRKLCWVDNKTMEAYRSDQNRQPTSMKLKYTRFLRWATPWDI